MGWMSFRVADHVEAYKVSGALQEAFFRLLGAAGAPKDAAIFSLFNSEDGSSEFFFSPKARRDRRRARQDLQRHGLRSA
jgi:hypothetical protein